jgi:hypothetical protein
MAGRESYNLMLKRLGRGALCLLQARFDLMTLGHKAQFRT